METTGCIAVPDGPGLGVRLDAERMGRYAELFRRTGGYAYDRTGSYDVVWLIAIALSGLAAVLNWPIRETPVPRIAAVRQAA